MGELPEAKERWALCGQAPEEASWSPRPCSPMLLNHGDDFQWDPLLTAHSESTVTSPSLQGEVTSMPGIDSF